MKHPFAHKLTMKQIVLLLVCTSAALYVLHYLIFRDLHHIGIIPRNKQHPFSGNVRVCGRFPDFMHRLNMASGNVNIPCGWCLPIIYTGSHMKNRRVL